MFLYLTVISSIFTYFWHISTSPVFALKALQWGEKWSRCKPHQSNVQLHLLGTSHFSLWSICNLTNVVGWRGSSVVLSKHLIKKLQSFCVCVTEKMKRRNVNPDWFFVRTKTFFAQWDCVALVFATFVS